MCKAFVPVTSLGGIVCKMCAHRCETCYEVHPTRSLPVPRVGQKCLVSIGDACTILATTQSELEEGLEHEVKIVHNTSVKGNKAIMYVEVETAKVPHTVTRKTLAWQNRFPSYQGSVGLLHVPRADAAVHLEVSYSTFDKWVKANLVRMSDRRPGCVEFPVHFEVPLE